MFRFSPYRGLKFAVHLAVADSVNDQHANEFWLEQAKLATKVRSSRQRTGEALAALVDDGFLELLEDNARAGRSNKYRFLYVDGLPVVYEARNTRPSRRAASRRKGVTSGDTPPGREVQPDVTGVTPQAAPGVTGRDTEPKKNPTQPNLLPSSPSTPAVHRDRLGEEEVDQFLDWICRRLDNHHADRLRHDPALTTLAATLAAELAGTGWTPAAAAAALTADPLDDARSIARVLTSRVPTLAAAPAPATTGHPGPVADCPHCHGCGWIAEQGAGSHVALCPCRTAA